MKVHVHVYIIRMKIKIIVSFRIINQYSLVLTGIELELAVSTTSLSICTGSTNLANSQSLVN